MVESVQGEAFLADNKCPFASRRLKNCIILRKEKEGHSVISLSY